MNQNKTMDFIDSTFLPPSPDIITSNNDELSAHTLNDNVNYHLAVLRSNRFIGSDIILMAKLKDVQKNFEQLKKLAAKRKKIAKKCTGTAQSN
ncbi:hypothetical protein ACI65C_011436 [Semiaphis heraclei]